MITKPVSVSEIEGHEVLQDFSIKTDHAMETWKPDLVVVDQKNRPCKFIYFAVPRDED